MHYYYNYYSYIWSSKADHAPRKAAAAVSLQSVRKPLYIVVPV